MAENLTLTAADGHEFNAYSARPTDAPKAGLIICQEVFGLNAHIRKMTDGFADEGYLAVAPALFDRVRRGVELDYTEEGLATGRELRNSIAWDHVILDVDAARTAVAEAGKVGVVGFCWGGSVVWLAASQLRLAAAVCYYGGYEHRDKRPTCPVMMHFGERDPITPIENVAEIRRLHPEAEMFVYPAGHGFNCDARANFDPESAALAYQRTLNFLARYLG